MGGIVHVIGAGVAGLACAISALRRGQRVAVYEATKRAGGRCRSFYDSALGKTFDNGSHVVLGGNPAVFKYLSLIDSQNELVPIDNTGAIPFVNIESGDKWTLRPNTGFIPWWILSRKKRVPRTRMRDYIRCLRLIWGSKDKSVADILATTNRTWPTFWQPFSTAVMNTDPEKASASLLGAALKKALLSTQGGLRPFVPRFSLAKTFSDPALAVLRGAGVPITFECPLVEIKGRSKANRLKFRSHSVALETDDKVVLAVPPWSPTVKPFLPQGFTPEPSPIINAHFALPEGVSSPHQAMTGIIGGHSHWIFTGPHLVSVTVSANTDLAGLEQALIADYLWHDVQRCFGWPSLPLPAHRIIIERRATPVQDLAFERLRPTTRTPVSNVFLAGDWIDTGLPCTLESAVQSGFKAADAVTKAG